MPLELEGGSVGAKVSSQASPPLSLPALTAFPRFSEGSPGCCKCHEELRHKIFSCSLKKKASAVLKTQSPTHSFIPSACCSKVYVEIRSGRDLGNASKHSATTAEPHIKISHTPRFFKFRPQAQRPPFRLRNHYFKLS